MKKKGFYQLLLGGIQMILCCNLIGSLAEIDRRDNYEMINSIMFLVTILMGISTNIYEAVFILFNLDNIIEGNESDICSNTYDNYCDCCYRDICEHGGIGGIHNISPSYNCCVCGTFPFIKSSLALFSLIYSSVHLFSSSKDEDISLDVGLSGYKHTLLDLWQGSFYLFIYELKQYLNIGAEAEHISYKLLIMKIWGFIKIVVGSIEGIALVYLFQILTDTFTKRDI
ncbi:MAG: hypothetical protein GY830_01285 [Bacteroidetes bacterium]|nr:hypothetical protein [Bacteroidota bacterium]